jgi:anti-sigma regulatory factor (Ser/Thr protein kinase)
MGDERILLVRNDVSELGRVAAEVALFAAEHGVAEKDLFDVTLALDEVLTNVVWYAFDDDLEHQIAVRLAFAAGELTLEVEDDGRAFDPLEVSLAEEELGLDVEERRIGGLGMYLVRHAMDALVYRREMGKNRLTMTKRLVVQE